MINKLILLNKKPKLNCLFYLNICILIFIIIFISLVKTYDSYTIVAINECENECNLNIVLPYNKIDILDNALVDINHNLYSIKSITYNEVTENNGIVFQNIALKTELQEESTRIYKIKLLKNKQRIIKKIAKVMKEG